MTTKILNLNDIKIEELVGPINGNVIDIDFQRLNVDAWSLKELADAIDETLNTNLEEGSLQDKITFFNFTIKDDVNEEDFLILTNLIITHLISKIATSERREREYRLGVPTTLSDLNLNVVNIKRLINYKCRVNKFNLHIETADHLNYYNMVE